MDSQEMSRARIRKLRKVLAKYRTADGEPCELCRRWTAEGLLVPIVDEKGDTLGFISSPEALAAGRHPLVVVTRNGRKNVESYNTGLLPVISLRGEVVGDIGLCTAGFVDLRDLKCKERSSKGWSAKK